MFSLIITHDIIYLYTHEMIMIHAFRLCRATGSQKSLVKDCTPFAIETQFLHIL